MNFWVFRDEKINIYVISVNIICYFANSFFNTFISVSPPELLLIPRK